MLLPERGGLRPMLRAAVSAAMLCAAGPWTLQIGPIPLSICTLVIYLLPYAMGWRWSTVVVCIYLLLGAAGIPVFSGFGGGIGKLLGPTGGYLIGYILLVIVCGLFVDRFPQKGMRRLGMALGTGVLYVCGTAWFCIQTGQTLLPALAACVLPFLPGDWLKIEAALYLGPALYRKIQQVSRHNR